MRNKRLLWLAFIVGIVAVAAMIFGLLFSGLADYRGNGIFSRDLSRYGFGPGRDMHGFMHGYGVTGDYGMMGGYGYGGMMGGYGYGGMMGGYGGMMGIQSGPVDASVRPISIDEANDAAGRFLDYYDGAQLQVGEIIEFSNGFYARIEERETGAGAFEIVINRNTGAVLFGPGPSLAWNTKYGPGYGYGMMDRGYRQVLRGANDATTDMPVEADDARDRARDYLERQFPGATAGEPAAFYGYYTLKVTMDQRTLGLLSVDGYDGRIWFHSWLGAFLSE
ncbi:MAG: hypothetical protein IBX61_07645 [Thermoleophilia bacterium]|nr:hypothetical protein [Thermoleophilia bacterium]